MCTVMDKVRLAINFWFSRFFLLHFDYDTASTPCFRFITHLFSSFHLNGSKIKPALHLIL